MALRAFFLYLSASHGTSDTNNHDPEIGLQILPEDTLEEGPADDANDIDNIDEEDVSDKEDADEIDEEPTEDPIESNKSRLRRRFSSATGFSTFPRTLSRTFSRSMTLVDRPTWLQKVKDFVFPPKEDIASFVPHYRHTPIISGLLIPFSILLEIPGLTEQWYIRTDNNQVVEHRSNPILLDVGLGISLACAIVANLCMITRFLEKRVKTMTVLSLIFLIIHDIINIVAVAIFSVQHRSNDGFTYGESFWMTVCSTVASSITIATLMWDLHHTVDFNKSGSGLTRRQRTLVIIIMILFSYICFGALINSLLIRLTFINGLYFTLVSIETIGFGDIVPKTTGSRVFICAYSAAGFLNLGVAIGMCRETILEAMEVAYKRRAGLIMERWKENRKKKHAEILWRRGIEWRLKEMGVPVWIRDRTWHGHRTGGGGRSVRRVSHNDLGILRRLAEWVGFAESHMHIGHSHITHGPHGMRLNLAALTYAELEASALEAGVPLDTLLPPDFVPAAEVPHHAHSSAHRSWIRHPLALHFENFFHPTQARTLTDAKLGGMSALITRFAIAAVHRHATAPEEPGDEAGPSNKNGNPTSEAVHSGESSKNKQANPSPTAAVNQGPSHHDLDEAHAHASDHLGHQMMQDLDTKAFYSKLIVAWSLFFIFWTCGSAIFMATEGWTYGISMYFCFVAFTTIGYGDYSPQTPAGRSVFVVWAILGVGTMTVLISVVQDAYGSRFKNAMHIKAFDKAVKRYRQRVQHGDYARGRHFHLRNRTAAAGDPSSPGKVRSKSRSSSAFSLSLAPGALEEHKTIVSESHARAQKNMEALPDHVLEHAKTFHAYINMFIDDENILDTTRGGSARAIARGGVGDVDSTLKKQLDEIAILGGIGTGAKEEILQDPDARHTLFVLSIEKALQRLIDAADDALEAIQDRDDLIAKLRQPDLEGEGDNGGSSKLSESTSAPTSPL